MANELGTSGGLSENEFKKELYNALLSSGTLNLLKSQLRAKLMDRLRDHNQDGIKSPNTRKQSSLQERLLISLFVDYLQSNEYCFTLSVFLPECQMGHWPPFSHQEMLQLFHLDTLSSFYRHMEKTSGENCCLAQKLVMGLQNMSFPNNSKEASTQTPDVFGQKKFDNYIPEIGEELLHKAQAQRLILDRNTEEQTNMFNEDLENYVHLQVRKLIDLQISNMRSEEAESKKQLIKAKQDADKFHKVDIEGLHGRETHFLEKLAAKQKEIETSAYEHRQRILSDLNNLRQREEKLKSYTDEQEVKLAQKEDLLAKKEKLLRSRESDLVHKCEILQIQANTFLQRKSTSGDENYKRFLKQLCNNKDNVNVETFKLMEETYFENNNNIKYDRGLLQVLQDRLARETTEKVLLLNTVKDMEHKLIHQDVEMNIYRGRLNESFFHSEHPSLVNSFLQQQINFEDVYNILRKKQDSHNQLQTLQEKLQNLESDFHSSQEKTLDRIRSSLLGSNNLKSDFHSSQEKTLDQRRSSLLGSNNLKENLTVLRDCTKKSCVCTEDAQAANAGNHIASTSEVDMSIRRFEDRNLLTQQNAPALGKTQTYLYPKEESPQTRQVGSDISAMPIRFKRDCESDHFTEQKAESHTLSRREAGDQKSHSATESRGQATKPASLHTGQGERSPAKRTISARRTSDSKETHDKRNPASKESHQSSELSLSEVTGASHKQTISSRARRHTRAQATSFDGSSRSSRVTSLHSKRGKVASRTSKECEVESRLSCCQKRNLTISLRKGKSHLEVCGGRRVDQSVRSSSSTCTESMHDANEEMTDKEPKLEACESPKLSKSTYHSHDRQIRTVAISRTRQQDLSCLLPGQDKYEDVGWYSEESCSNHGCAARLIKLPQRPVSRKFHKTIQEDGTGSVTATNVEHNSPNQQIQEHKATNSSVVHSEQDSYSPDERSNQETAKICRNHESLNTSCASGRTSTSR